MLNRVPGPAIVVLPAVSAEPMGEVTPTGLRGVGDERVPLVNLGPSSIEKNLS